MKKKYSNAVKKKQDLLNSLVSLKTSALHDLIRIQDEYNSLVDLNIDADEWLTGLSIDSLKTLNDVENRRTRLGDVRIRAKLKKDSVKVIEELENLDKKIKITRIDLVNEKIQAALNNSK